MGRLKKGGMAIEEMTATSRLQDLHACLLGVTRLLMDTSKNSDFVTIRCCSQKMFPYISIICCVNIFYSRLVLFRTLNF
ncbi:MAG: hypothetical protein WAT68_10690, partial [Candidatus Nitrotoga sp.]